jgi:chromate transporter
MNIKDQPADSELNDQSHKLPTDEPLFKLFLRFLKFGFLAWGGPVSQIDMIRQELVEEQRWISRSHFRKLLAVYQVLPGPEAHELCVHFGMLVRGKIGGILAGLGFMLPGFIFMFVLSWLYLSFGLADTVFEAIFRGIQPAVIALIVRAIHRIGSHTLLDAALWVIAMLAAVADLLGISFWISLPMGGIAYILFRQKRILWAVICAVVFMSFVVFTSPIIRGQKTSKLSNDATRQSLVSETGKPSNSDLFISGLRSGLLTFGGAYTVIPFLEGDAVERGKWMTRQDFLDGLALSGALPAPLIIFSTFVGFFGGGPLGAFVMTIGIFLPAFSFSLLFHRHLERVIENPYLHHFLEGVTAAVVGLIGVTLIGLAKTAITNGWAVGIFAVILAILYLWKSKATIPIAVASAGVIGWLLF